jgi:hypothetical protein
MYLTDLGFCGENRLSDRCIRLALDSPARTNPMLRLLHPIGFGVFRREQIKWLFKFSTSFRPALKFYLIILYLCCVLFQLEGEC